MAEAIDPLAAMEEPKYFEDISTKEKQINTLARMKPHLIIVKENAEYAILFKVNSKQMNLIVNLPHDFPSEAPDFFVVPALKHPWVNKKTNSVKPTPRDLQFNNKKRLGLIVQAIIFEFKESYLRRLSLEQLAFSDDLNYIKIKSTTVPSANGFTLRRLEETMKDSRANQDLENATKELITGIELKAIDIMNMYEEAAILANVDVTDIRALKIEAIQEAALWKNKNTEEEFDMLNDKYQKIAKLYDTEFIRSRLAIVINEDDKSLNVAARQFQFGLLPIEEFVQFINKYCLKKLGNFYRSPGKEDDKSTFKVSTKNKKGESSGESKKLTKVVEVDEEKDIAEDKVDAENKEEEKKKNQKGKTNLKELEKTLPAEEKLAKVMKDKSDVKGGKLKKILFKENTAKESTEKKEIDGGNGSKDKRVADVEKMKRELKRDAKGAKEDEVFEGKEPIKGMKVKKVVDGEKGKKEGGMKDGKNIRPKSTGE